MRKAREFLEAGNKVQITCLFRGREMAHIEEGRRVMNDVLEELEELGKVEQAPQQHGRRMIAMVVPR